MSKYHRITIYVPLVVSIPKSKIPQLESSFRKRWDKPADDKEEVSDEDLLIEAQQADVVDLPEDYRL